MNLSSVVALIRKGYGLLITGASSLRSVFLLIIRLYWGSQFFMTGMGKLENIDKIVSFFQSLGIPFPKLNAYLAGSTECIGGLLLFIGLASRLSAIPLIFTLIIAYSTADRDALFSIFSAPDKFTSADPFLFLFAAIIVLIFGPGWISVDGLVKRILDKRTVENMPPSDATPT